MSALARRRIRALATKSGVEVVSYRTAILEYIRQCDHSPTMREIATAVGIPSPGSVHYHLQELERSGEIIRKNGRIVVAR